MMNPAFTDQRSDKIDEVEEAFAQLHQAYLLSIRQHRALVGDLCATLIRLEAALDAVEIDPKERRALTAGIGRHVDAARAIVSHIDGTLTTAAAAAPPCGFH
jgi:hypothetical protein